MNETEKSIESEKRFNEPVLEWFCSKPVLNLRRAKAAEIAVNCEQDLVELLGEYCQTLDEDAAILQRLEKLGSSFLKEHPEARPKFLHDGQVSVLRWQNEYRRKEEAIRTQIAGERWFRRFQKTFTKWEKEMSGCRKMLFEEAVRSFASTCGMAASLDPALSLSECRQILGELVQDNPEEMRDIVYYGLFQHVRLNPGDDATSGGYLRRVLLGSVFRLLIAGRSRNLDLSEKDVLSSLEEMLKDQCRSRKALEELDHVLIGLIRRQDGWLRPLLTEQPVCPCQPDQQAETDGPQPEAERITYEQYQAYTRKFEADLETALQNYPQSLFASIQRDEAAKKNRKEKPGQDQEVMRRMDVIRACTDFCRQAAAESGSQDSLSQLYERVFAHSFSDLPDIAAAMLGFCSSSYYPQILACHEKWQERSHMSLKARKNALTSLTVFIGNDEAFAALDLDEKLFSLFGGCRALTSYELFACYADPGSTETNDPGMIERASEAQKDLLEGFVLLIRLACHLLYSDLNKRQEDEKLEAALYALAYTKGGRPGQSLRPSYRFLWQALGEMRSRLKSRELAMVQVLLSLLALDEPAARNEWKRVLLENGPFGAVGSLHQAYSRFNRKYKKMAVGKEIVEHPAFMHDAAWLFLLEFLEEPLFLGGSSLYYGLERLWLHQPLHTALAFPALDPPSDSARLAESFLEERETGKEAENREMQSNEQGLLQEEAEAAVSKRDFEADFRKELSALLDSLKSSAENRKQFLALYPMLNQGENRLFVTDPFLREEAGLFRHFYESALLCALDLIWKTPALHALWNETSDPHKMLLLMLLARQQEMEKRWLLQDLPDAFHQDPLHEKVRSLEAQNQELEKQLKKARADLQRADTLKKEAAETANRISEAYRKGYKLAKDEASEEIRRLRKEEKGRRKERGLEAEERRELCQLRSLLFSQETLDEARQSEAAVQELSAREQERLERFLKGHRVIFVGGHERLLRALQNKYRSGHFINSLNTNLNVFARADLVVFFPKFLNHALYYKSVEAAHQNNVPFDYVNFRNLEVTERRLLEIIDNYEEPKAG